MMGRGPACIGCFTRFIGRIAPRCYARVSVSRVAWYQGSVLLLTFISYVAYHMSRKPLSVVKNVLMQNCTEPVENDAACGWEPFNGADSSRLLGLLDSIFLFAYAFGMFFSGILAERMDLRFFLTLGMLFSSLTTYLFGLAKSLGIHNFGYFALVQFFGGLVQTTGWPGVVACIGNWFGKSKRGLIFGVWNSHTSVGNILGSVMSGYYVDIDWSRSFIVPAMVMAGMACLVFMFLVPEPKDVGCEEPVHHEFNPSRSVQVFSTDGGSDEEEATSGGSREECRNLVSSRGFGLSSGSEQSSGVGYRLLGTMSRKLKFPLSWENRRGQEAISFSAALRIPGVIEFSISLFFSKLVSYTFLYWLPPFIKQNTPFGNSDAAYLSTLFDLGGIIGGVAAGFISDHSSMSACTCACMLVAAVPVMFAYQYTSVGTTSLGPSIALLSLMGFLVNGPYALITTAVSAELGVHPSLQGNAKAKATVAAIIDGTGSIGAAVGPLVTGFLSRGQNSNWNDVFYFLMASEVISFIFLIRLVREELKKWRERRFVRRT